MRRVIWENKHTGEDEIKSVKLKGLDCSFSLNSLITSTHGGLCCHSKVPMTLDSVEAKTGMGTFEFN